MRGATIQIDGGILEWAGQAAALAGTLLLILFLVALGGIAYKHLRGGGIEWPDDRTGDEAGELGAGAGGERSPEDDEDDGTTLRRGSEDDEWKYY
ncbi:hypothetical protein SAMN05192561_10845 [Halopenitus malekzadehii]|uniref:Uncharacterized protein n=1 Tax=Halopenitus malekzadehii TaxID=1267564 RepID=A0A1H6J5H2_9EURY|nr:hypothetical protein [Halopenitus malekzadehii]SEH57180.1 hypothetical protein SAMN05192561_10845 [Halopenitus malekzadehii]